MHLPSKQIPRLVVIPYYRFHLIEADPDDDLQIDYTDNDEQVANYIGDGLVEAVSAGTTTFYVSVWGGDLTPYTVLNGESMHFTVNVSSYGLRVSSENVTDVPVTKSNMDDERVISLEDMPGWDKYKPNQDTSTTRLAKVSPFYGAAETIGIFDMNGHYVGISTQGLPQGRYIVR